MRALTGIVLVRWLHLMAAVTWMGGMLFLVLVIVPALRGRLEPGQRMELVGQVGKRFSYVGWGAVAVLVPSGVLLAMDRGMTWDNLLSTSYGIVLSIKIALVAGMIALSYLHDFVLGPRLVELSSAPGADTEGLQNRVRVLSRTNVLLGILVLLCVAILTS